MCTVDLTTGMMLSTSSARKVVAGPSTGLLASLAALPFFFLLEGSFFSSSVATGSAEAGSAAQMKVYSRATSWTPTRMQISRRSLRCTSEVVKTDWGRV